MDILHVTSLQVQCGLYNYCTVSKWCAAKQIVMLSQGIWKDPPNDLLGRIVISSPDYNTFYTKPWLLKCSFKNYSTMQWKLSLRILFTSVKKLVPKCPKSWKRKKAGQPVITDHILNLFSFPFQIIMAAMSWLIYITVLWCCCPCQSRSKCLKFAFIRDRNVQIFHWQYVSTDSFVNFNL